LISRARASDPGTLERLFGSAEGLLPLWIAEPDLEVAPAVVAALQARATESWYGYEMRPRDLADAFWSWMQARHGWERADLEASVSSSVGTSIAVLIEMLTAQGDGVIIQPPVFTDFKPLVTRAGRSAIRNPLTEDDGRYAMDLAGLAGLAAEPDTTMLILCYPHNPVGRVWSRDELRAVAEICARNRVFVVSDEIHADIIAPGRVFTPFAVAAAGTGVSWAATHGPIKTFGLAGVCDSLLITGDHGIAKRFRSRASGLHLNRNNVFGMVAFAAAYRDGGPWLDDLLGLVAANSALLEERLPDGVRVVSPEGTYLAWLDFRSLGMDVPELARWLPAEAGLALSPGHWFGRQGAGFARMTIAVPARTVERAIGRLSGAVARLAESRGPT